MIRRSDDFDLGQDKTRMKDPADEARQSQTVDEILERFFSRKKNNRWEIQILADEVGMGKTFVALATAYSILKEMKYGSPPDSLRKCYKKIVIVTPKNAALFKKWQREVSEFVKRCVKPSQQQDAQKWFRGVAVEREDDLVNEIRRGGKSPNVIVTHMGAFGKRFLSLDIKQREILAYLFQYWGNRFNLNKRRVLLKGAPEHWPSKPEDCRIFQNWELDRLPFPLDDLLSAIKKIDHDTDLIESLRVRCNEIVVPRTRHRDQLFKGVETHLRKIYREILVRLLGSSLPLVIVDEAHNWKNGPTRNANGYNRFVDLIGSRSRRALLLTATPFQLRPSEMLEILKVGDELQPSPTNAESNERVERLAEQREKVIRPVLDNSARASARFAKRWSLLSPRVTTQMIREAWSLPEVELARKRLDTEAQKTGLAKQGKLDDIISACIGGIDPDIRLLIREALYLYVYNSDLSYEMSRIVIRHRRRAEHRKYRVGNEYTTGGDQETRPDQHVLHASPGVDVRGEGELPHYLLMRCVSEMKQGKGKSSLGNALTGCYSTLRESAEGRKVKQVLSKSDLGKVYLDLLWKMVQPRKDPKHPKVQEVVQSAVENWKAGEKTLIFCFRANNAKRLNEIISSKIEAEMRKQRKSCLGSAEDLKSLRARLTSKTRELIVIGLDRVLWSILCNPKIADGVSPKLTGKDFRLTDDELVKLAKIGLMCGFNFSGKRIDRVLLNRITEHLLAKRILRTRACTGLAKTILNDLASMDWVRYPYGQRYSILDDDHEHGAHFDERGVHTVYSNVRYITDERASEVGQTLVERRKRQEHSILDFYADAPSLWLESNIQSADNKDRNSNGNNTQQIFNLHQCLWELTSPDGKELDWESRKMVFQAIRRSVFRESVLVRLLPKKRALDSSTWGEMLVKAFQSPLPRQNESMLDRIFVYAEDVLSASGRLTDVDSQRYALYEATALRGSQTVAVVSGATHKMARTRLFQGFNTPLEPEILICTSVGQEGIDLHRHCRHVVHFDLAWNPATLEQRTGRADRIGSKTFREREIATSGSTSHLDIGVPYLAGTYDERMYEELRLRAQTFEVLTGGDLAVDSQPEDQTEETEGKDSEFKFVPLPDEMIQSMRVNLHVWRDQSAPEGGNQNS